MEKTHNSGADPQSTALESCLRTTIDTIPEQVWSALPDGSIDFVNQSWRQYTGLSLEDRLDWHVTVHPEDLPALMGEWRRAVASGELFETRFRRADGEYRMLLLRAAPLRDELGNLLKWYGTSIVVERRLPAVTDRIAQRIGRSERKRG
jgi:PAS domain S-box-containing protein